MIRRLFFFISTIILLLTACSDNDSFSADASHRLTFSKDTVRLDTLFSTVPSCTYTFWVYNNSGDGIRIRSVRLDRGSQSGFRVNVDGSFLNPVANDIEVRKGDSIRVFVEITSLETKTEEPKLVEDNLLFTLESGAVQRVNLRTYSWDADKITNLVVSGNQTIESKKPIIVYGRGILIEKGATLTLKNTSLYFHADAGIEVQGKLEVENVQMRGDRLDHMFDYLPYDRVSGQWKGITVRPKSQGIVMKKTVVRNAATALSCDSTTVTLEQVAIYNNQGFGLTAHDSEVSLDNCLLSNSLNDCLVLRGCQAKVNQTTLAQFYPFSANRGAALRFAKTEKPLYLVCTNLVVTGYDSDVVFREGRDEETVEFSFENCLLRTPSLDDADAFKDIIWEKPTDEIQGQKHFVTFDDVNFIYDFRLKEESPAYEKKMGWTGIDDNTTK